MNVQTVAVNGLDYAVEFDSVFTLEPHAKFNSHVVTTYHARASKIDVTGAHAPYVYVDGAVDEYGDVHVTELPYMDGSGWSFYSVGYSQQSGQLRKDPTMHTSEILSGDLARDMIMDGGTFAITEVIILTDQEDTPEHTYSGWVVLRRDDE